jgi:hypothetical protein
LSALTARRFITFRITAPHQRPLAHKSTSRQMTPMVRARSRQSFRA